MTGTATPATEPDTDAREVTLERTIWGRMDRREVLGAFADGLYITPVFGPERPLVADSIASHLRGIIPTREDAMRNAFGYGNERRIRAYRNGREYMLATYWGYVSAEDLPDVNDLDGLPEGIEDRGR